MMFSFTANDGRILTPPKELKPILKEAYSAFYKLLGHIRFFYVVDEIGSGRAPAGTTLGKIMSESVNNDRYCQWCFTIQ